MILAYNIPSMSNGTCFVIQPFSEPYNQRFYDVYEPAVRAAGFEPYRVDLDPTVDQIVEKIQAGIRDAVICLADISLDNANVFYELGAAHALGKDVVMVCDKSQRTTKLPFDVAHRTVLMFTPASSSDFEKLGSSITSKLQAMVKQRGEIRQLSAMPLANLDGLEPMELTLLVILAESEEPVSYISLTHSMERAGYTKVASRIALLRLLEAKLVDPGVQQTRDGDYEGYFPTSGGLTWLVRNKDKIKLRRDPPKSRGEPGIDEPRF